MKKRVLMVLVVLTWAAAAWAQTGDMDPIAVGAGKYKLHYENDRVRVLEVAFEPGESVGMHSHPDHAAYFIEGGTIKITNSDGTEQVLEAKTGDAVWLPAVTHKGENTGKTRIRVLVTELKEPAPAKPAAEPAAEKK